MKLRIDKVEVDVAGLGGALLGGRLDATADLRRLEAELAEVRRQLEDTQRALSAALQHEKRYADALLRERERNNQLSTALVLGAMGSAAS